jgi:hypothetical protein
MKAPFSHLSHLSHRRRSRRRRHRRHRRHCASSREAWGSAAHWSVGSTPCVHREGGRGAGVVLDPRDRGKGHGRGCGVVCVPLFLGGARSAADGRLIAGVTKAGHVLVMWGAGAEGNTSCVRGPLRVWGVYRVHAGRGTVAIKHHMLHVHGHPSAPQYIACHRARRHGVCTSCARVCRRAAAAT